MQYEIINTKTNEVAAITTVKSYATIIAQALRENYRNEDFVVGGK